MTCRVKQFLQSPHASLICLSWDLAPISQMGGGISENCIDIIELSCTVGSVLAIEKQNFFIAFMEFIENLQACLYKRVKAL